MLISCKCLNFVATSNSQQQLQSQRASVNANANVSVNSSNAAVAVAPASPSPVPMSPAPQADAVWWEHSSSNDNVDNNSVAGVSGNSVAEVGGNAVAVVGGNAVAAALMDAFLLKYPRNFVFYSQSMDFFKQAIGPIPDLTINAVNQRDLIFSLTLEVPSQQPQTPSVSWQISICINCNTTLCAKRLTVANHPPSQFLLNCSLLTNNDELAKRRADKSFSETFGLLIMDHPPPTLQDLLACGAPGTSFASFTVGSMTPSSLSTFGFTSPHDPKQQRLRQLQQHLQQRLKREIAETDERIQRYTEQQFALLKSFREKSEQEYDQLVVLVQRIPQPTTQQQQQQQQPHVEWLDRAPPAFEVNAAASFASRRRNTIGSRRDVNSGSGVATMAPTTPTALNPTVNMLALPAASAIEAAHTPQTSGATPFFSNGRISSTAVITANVSNRKMSNFDTPPVTPEATPMSVGNSPTFRQQQQQQQQQQLPPPPFSRFVTVAAAANNKVSFQQQFPTPTAESADDFLFELEGVDAAVPTSSVSFNSPMQRFYQQQQQQQQHVQLQRSMSKRADEYESDDDDAEEAEDALALDSAMPIPMRNASRIDMMNFARSLPIAIANSPMAAGRSYMGDSDEDDVDNALDNTVDIAASIKALAKSVHGEAVFGDLPRPRLRSQI